MKNTRMMSAAVAVSFCFLGAAVADDATVVAPDHYKVEFENDKVRVIRITYGPGEASAMHEHGDGVVVNLTETNVAFTMADGSTPAAEPGAAGSFLWSPAQMHAAKNNGGRAEALFIEIKD